jgi:hypothetical protein
MKPNFALNLTFDGIGLLHRVPSGWHLVGEVAIEAPDMGAALAVLRQTALALDPAGLRSKLVIPNEQIRFLTLQTDPHATETNVRAALEGATPYAVDDLAYDWTLEGDTLHIAAVARETLAEAEAFAMSHGFNPVSFVATPDQSVFPGEPFFGLTGAAPTLVGAGVPVARDLQPIRVIGHARMPDPAPAPDPVPSEAATSALATVETAMPVVDTAAAAGNADRTRAAALPADTDVGITAMSTPAPAGMPPVQPAAPTFASVRTRPAGLVTEQAAAGSNQPETMPDTLSDATSGAMSGADEPAIVNDRPAARTDSPATPGAQNAAERPAGARAGAGKTATNPAGAGKTGTFNAGVTAPRIAADTLRPRRAAPPAKHPEPPAASPRVSLSPASRGPIPGAPPQPAPAANRPRRGANFSGATAAFVAMLGRALRRPPITGLTPPLLPANDLTAVERDKMTVFGARKPAEAGAVALPARGKPRYLGLALTLVLLVFLAGVAAWASIFGETTLGWLRGDDAPAVAGLSDTETITTRLVEPGQAPADPSIAIIDPDQPDQDALLPDAALATNLDGLTPEELVDSEPETADAQIVTDIVIPDLPVSNLPVANVTNSDLVIADQTDPDLATADTTAVDIAALDLADDTSPAMAAPFDTGLSEPAPPALPPVVRPETAADAAARYAATGIWQVAPDAPSAPGLIDLDALYIASIDPAIRADDAVALPTMVALRPDGPPAPLSSPAAAGTTFRLDARGLVEATPDGAFTPDGVRVVAGRPPVVPPAAVLTRAAPAPVVVVPPTARLAAFRPRARPDNLSDGAERAALGGLTRTELAEFRPRPRPAAVIARADAQAKEAAVAATVATASAAAAATAAASTAAVALVQGAAQPLDRAPAVKPRLRPQDLGLPDGKAREASVADSRARDNDAGSPEPGADASTAGSISREEAEDDEGEVQVASARGKTVQPSVPSQANVARTATEKNVLNLREVNLIGVYGTQQSRRALVRLSNGRYQKVKVGDRVDGGRVVAISDGELRYTKGGRNVTLRMPRS